MQNSLRLSVSIVVPVYNAEKTIEKCVSSLLNQSYPVEEIILVDDGSTDSTRKILRKISKRHHDRVKVKEINHRGRSGVRNVGLNISKGDIVAFAEADAIYDKDWLANALKRLEDNNVAGVLGARYCWATDTIVSRCIDLGLQIYYKDPNYKPPAGWVYKKSLLLDVGGFDEKLPVAEDRDLGLRLMKRGYSIVYEPSSVWWHMEPRTLREFIRKTYMHSRDHIWFYIKYPLKFPYLRVLLTVGYLMFLLISLATVNLWTFLLLLGILPALISSQTFRLLIKARRESVKFIPSNLLIIASLNLIKNAVFVSGIIISFGKLLISRQIFISKPKQLIV